MANIPTPNLWDNFNIQLLILSFCHIVFNKYILVYVYDNWVPLVLVCPGNILGHIITMNIDLWPRTL